MKNNLNRFTLASLTCFGVLSLSLIACSQAVTVKKYTDYTPGDMIETLGDVSLDLDNAFFDDFTNGIDYDKWMIGSGAWGNGNGGVVPENVFYTEDGVVILRGNGMYYARGEVKGLGVLKDGRNTGSVLISKFKVRPGHYEVKMKPLPRLGACTAFWTYTNRLPTVYEVNDNHEIDIELPGGKTSNAISFKNVLNTNYVTEGMNISKDISLADVTDGNTINLADGQFHTFGFDWYTDPEVVIYSVDGHISAISELFVPYLESKLWLGNWFPNNSGFVGDSLFETDYMLIDWVKYIPFLDQPYEEWDASVSVNCAQRSQYPSSPIILPKANMFANGDFDALLRVENNNNYGWQFSKLNGYETVPVESVCYVDEHNGMDGSPCATLKEGGYLSTVIDSVYEGQPYDFSFMSKSNAEQASMIIRYRDVTQTEIEKQTIRISGESFKEYKQTLIPPEGTHSIYIQIYFTDKNCPGTYLVLDDFNLERAF